jgi:hypothetical protein
VDGRDLDRTQDGGHPAHRKSHYRLFFHPGLARGIGGHGAQVFHLAQAEGAACPGARPGIRQEYPKAVLNQHLRFIQQAVAVGSQPANQQNHDPVLRGAPPAFQGQAFAGGQGDAGQAGA